MKKTLKFLSSVLLIATLGLVNCSKYETGGSSTNGYVVASYINGLVRSAVSGNCAISLNLGSLYAGAIFQGAVESTTNFTQAQYEAASGSTIAAQGYTTYAQVPFNKRYDAFLNNPASSTVWTEALRNTSLGNQKAATDLSSLLGAAAIASGNGQLGSVGSAASVAVATTFLNSFSAAEQTAMGTFATSIGQGANFGTAALLATAISGVQTGASLANWGGLATTLGGGSAATGITNSYSAYMARYSWRSGMAILGCSRIPRSSCNLGAIATSSLATDISNQAGVANLLLNNADCRKNTSTGISSTRILTALFAGLAKETVVTQGGFTYQNSTTDSFGNTTALASVYGASEGGATRATSWISAIPLIASKAYPKSSALTALGFSAAFPLASGTTAYPVTTGTAVPTSQTAQTDAAAPAAGIVPWHGGSNINLASVTSCEGLGLGSVGPTPVTTAVGSTTAPAGTLPALTTGTVDTTTTQASRKTLTDVKEILYAFSTQNSAASTYAGLSGVSYANATGGVNPVTTVGAGTQGYQDAVACNTSLRKTLSISSVLGVGTTLPVIGTASGDGNASTLLTACIYGGTTASRTIAASVLTNSLLNISACPTAAAAGASTFGEYGLTSLSTATTANQIDGKP